MALSPLPDVGQVRRPAKRHDEDRIDAHVVHAVHVPWHQPLGGDRDPAKAPFIERKTSRIGVCASLALDATERAPAIGDNVDVSPGDAGAASKDSPAVQTKVP